MDKLVQIILLRKDLTKKYNYSRGAVVAQGCHASVAVIIENLDDDDTKEYVDQLLSMHKIVLGVSDDSMLQSYVDKLRENNILHHLWMEQPENIPTCVALKPYPRNVVNPFFKDLKLY